MALEGALSRACGLPSLSGAVAVQQLLTDKPESGLTDEWQRLGEAAGAWLKGLEQVQVPRFRDTRLLELAMAARPTACWPASNGSTDERS